VQCLVETVMNNVLLAPRRRAHLQLLSTLACLAAGAGIAACAADTPHNPDALADPQISAVQQICQSVLGLSPAEGSNGATLIPANRHLAAGTTHYQGCVASLSDSLQAASVRESTQAADAACRARGLASDGGALALCVLQQMHTSDARGSASLQPAINQGPGTAPRATGSFFYAFAGQVRQREQLACAALGLEPGTEEFSNCVSGLRSTFFAIDNPID
jgi:hypothetical protein